MLYWLMGSELFSGLLEFLAVSFWFAWPPLFVYTFTKVLWRVMEDRAAPEYEAEHKNWTFPALVAGCGASLLLTMLTAVIIWNQM